MKKFIPPSIVIWNLELYDKKDGTVAMNIYFLFCCMAKRYMKKHKTELKEYDADLLAEPLWLW